MMELFRIFMLCSFCSSLFLHNLGFRWLSILFFCFCSVPLSRPYISEKEIEDYSHVSKIKHDVFISFRGKDVRRGLLSHLVRELRRRQIDAYVDYRLERGDEISSSLVSAIEGSQVLLVIFSKNYASSKWCLNELVKMVECAERNKQILVPVFYNVEPSDVRHQRRGYGAALAKHEGKQDMDNWISSLRKAAQFSGFQYSDSSSNFENESDLVDEIVKDISNKLIKYCSSDSDDPSESNGFVGIDQNIAWIKSLLTSEPREVLMLGIWGMGGIGKTTIARVAFEDFSPNYEGCCFLENVREEWEKHGLSYLQDKLVSELLEGESTHINIGKANSSTFLKNRLNRKKVLIVLDDVNTPKLLKDLLEPIRFGPGSRVIVTSRDKHVFTARRFHVHKIKQLNFDESLELFCMNAFDESQPKMGYEELSKKAVAIAKGIPLTLIVFGSYLHSKNKDTWECALEKLKKYPNRDIQRVLKLSYDELDDLEKNVFLDIAFFFKEDDKDYVIKQLNAWGFYGDSGIQVLEEKSLITISNDNRIQMHDLIQEMGWEIVHQESINPGRRSRLKDAKDIYDALKNNKGTDLVEGMLLDASQIGEGALNVDSLKRMPNLRLLKVYSPLPVEVPIQTTCYVPEGLVNVKEPGLDHTLQQFVKLQKLSKLPGIDKMLNYKDGVVILERNQASGSTKKLMPIHSTLNIGSVLKQLTDLGVEVHLKTLHYLFMDGCSVPKDFSIWLKEKMRPPSELPEVITRMVKEMRVMELLSSSTVHYNSLECTENEGLVQLETLPKGLPLLSSTYYHSLGNCREQGGDGTVTGKPKLLKVLVDGFRCSEQVSFCQSQVAGVHFWHWKSAVSLALSRRSEKQGGTRLLEKAIKNQISQKIKKKLGGRQRQNSFSAFHSDSHDHEFISHTRSRTNPLMEKQLSMNQKSEE